VKPTIAQTADLVHLSIKLGIK